jgi:hypothetical protein
MEMEFASFLDNYIISYIYIYIYIYKISSQLMKAFSLKGINIGPPIPFSDQMLQGTISSSLFDTRLIFVLITIRAI